MIATLGMLAVVFGQATDAETLYIEAAKLLKSSGGQVAVIGGGDLPQAILGSNSDRVANVLALVEKGNAMPLKPVTHRTVLEAFDAMKVSPLIELGQALTDYSDLNFSRGNSTEAIRALLLNEQMHYRYADSSIVNFMFYSGVASRVFSQIQTWLPSIKQDDWSRLIELAKTRLADSDVLRRLLESERSQSLNYDGELKADYLNGSPFSGGGCLEGPPDLDPKEDAYWEGLTQKRWNSIFDRLSAWHQSQYVKIKNSLLKSESKWQYRSDEVTLPPCIHSDDDAFGTLCYRLPLMFPEQGKYLVRAQFRLLILHGRLRSHILKTQKIPATLATVASAPERFDPLSGKEFIYRPFSNGYRLFSTGRSDLIGEIELGFKPPLANGDEEKAAPP